MYRVDEFRGAFKLSNSSVRHVLKRKLKDVGKYPDIFDAKYMMGFVDSLLYLTKPFTRDYSILTRLSEFYYGRNLKDRIKGP